MSRVQIPSPAPNLQNMKSIRHGTAGANCKLRGKLTKNLSCGCCQLQNWKWTERIKAANQEIKQFIKQE